MRKHFIHSPLNIVSQSEIPDDAHLNAAAPLPADPAIKAKVKSQRSFTGLPSYKKLNSKVKHPITLSAWYKPNSCRLCTVQRIKFS